MCNFVDISLGFILIANAHLVERKDHVFISKKRKNDEGSNKNKGDAPAPMTGNKKVDIEKSGYNSKNNSDDKSAHDLRFNSGDTFKFDGNRSRQGRDFYCSTTRQIFLEIFSIESVVGMKVTFHVD